MRDIVKTLKINHYIKNLIILLPIIFVGEVTDVSRLFEAVKAMVLFCLSSSIVYIFNDLKDIKKDKHHPLKKLRPIASGAISGKEAHIIMGVLALVVVSMSFCVNKKCDAVIGLYLALNILYAVSLKNYKFIDILCIATGFLLRALAGFYAISAPVSISMLTMVFITSIFFTSSKRVLEFKLFPNQNERRNSMQNITDKTLSRLLYGSAIASILSYNLLAVIYSKSVAYLYLTGFPFIFFITRLLFLVKDTETHDDPIKFIENDKQIKALIIVYILMLLGLSVFR